MDREPDFDALETHASRPTGRLPAIERARSRPSTRTASTGPCSTPCSSRRDTSSGFPSSRRDRSRVSRSRVRTQFEERYVEAIRRVGSKLLEAGEIPTAWAYFRAIAEPEPVSAALESYSPGDDAERRRPGHRRRVQPGGQHPSAGSS